MEERELTQRERKAIYDLRSAFSDLGEEGSNILDAVYLDRILRSESDAEIFLSTFLVAAEEKFGGHDLMEKILLPSIENVEKLGGKLRLGKVTRVTDEDAETYDPEEEKKKGFMDILLDKLSESTDMLIKYICIAGCAWHRKHPDEHIMPDVIIPACKIMGELMGFGLAYSTDPLKKEQVDRLMKEFNARIQKVKEEDDGKDE